MLKWRVFFLALVLSSVSLWAQAPTEETTAVPVPAQIITGKKIFISNAQGESSAVTAAPNQTYNEFYAAMKAWGRHELVGNAGGG